MKRKVFTDGNGSTAILVEGLGDYVPVKEAVALEKRIAELTAQVEHLRKLHSDLTNADMVFDDETHSGYLIANDQLEDMEHILSGSSQCLAEHDAEVAARAYQEGYSEGWRDCSYGNGYNSNVKATEYANQLLKQADDGE